MFAKKYVQIMMMLCLLQPLSVFHELHAVQDDAHESDDGDGLMVDRCSDQALQADQAQDALEQERATEVLIGTPWFYLKMLSDDPFVQGMMGVIGLVSLVAISYQVYCHI